MRGFFFINRSSCLSHFFKQSIILVNEICNSVLMYPGQVVLYLVAIIFAINKGAILNAC